MSSNLSVSVSHATRASGSPSVSRSSACDARKLPLAWAAPLLDPAAAQNPAAAPRHYPAPFKMAIGRDGGGAEEAARMSRSDELWKVRLSRPMLD